MTESLGVGIICYPTFGGSGVVATEIGIAMARRGHRVHFIAWDVPGRLGEWIANVRFHAVEARDYPLFRHEPYTIALASKLVEVASFEGLDVVHVHYAVPHAASAFLAAQVLGDKAPKVLTTLHGTDITLVGADPSYLPITRFSIQRSDAVTAPSQFLRNATREILGVGDETPIEVIPNFVDTDRWSPAEQRDRRAVAALCGPPVDGVDPALPVLVHVSNFRPLKRVCDVVEIFRRVTERHPARLVLVGDGPERSRAERQVHALGLGDRTAFLGKQERFDEVLRHADVFLLPSETESFGLAALEALSCGVPVVASRVGGLPEVVADGETGYLLPVGDVAAMADRVIQLLDDPALLARMRVAARHRALTCFPQEPVIDRYEALYHTLAGR